MKKFFKKIGIKKIIIAAAVLLVVVAAVVAFIIFGGKKNVKTVEVKVDQNYSEIIKKNDATFDQVDKSLKDFAKTQNGDETIYIKGSETIRVRADENGNVTYISYNNNLGDDVQVKLKDFNESMIKIGDSESDVLALLEKYDYIYNLKTINDEGKALHIYYYGWTSEKAILELVFTDGKLTYYTVNSQDIAAKSDVPAIGE